MRDRESDWLGHITWRGEEEDQGVYPREYRQGSEKACKLGLQFTHILILEFHESNTSLFSIEFQLLYKEKGGKIQKQRV